MVDALLTVALEAATVNTRARTLASLVAVATLTAACGGDSASTATAPDTTSPATTPVTTPVTTPATTPVTTSAVATTADDPSLPDWASGEMVTVGADTGPLELPVELVPFCEASRSYYVAATALAYVEDGQVGTAQQLFAALAALAPMAIEAAPSEEFAVEPTAAREQLAVLIPAFEEIGYDASGLVDSTDADVIRDTLNEFGATRASLEEFLLAACGADSEVLDEQARGAATAAAAAAGETIEPEVPVEAAAGVLIANASDTIEVSVPAEWTTTEELSEEGRSALVATTDLDGFYGLVTPGVLVLRGEGGFRDGGYFGRLLEFEADLLDGGCVGTDEREYRDSTYDGYERVYDCGVDGLEVRLFGGATEDESLYAMALLVGPADDLSIRQLIVESFYVS